MADSVAEPDLQANLRRRFHRTRRAGKWTLGIFAAVVLLLVAAVVVLNTQLGERFLADRIARQTFPNGLNIAIGRIDGNIYGKATLRDVRVSDPKGVFLTIPRAEIDWNPRAWLANRLDIDSFAARRASMSRIPEFLPSEDDGPILPGFDISVDELTIDNLMLAPGIAGERAQRVDLDAEVQVTNRKLFVDADAQLGRRDRLALLVNAEPVAAPVKRAAPANEVAAPRVSSAPAPTGALPLNDKQRSILQAMLGDLRDLRDMIGSK